MSSPAGAPTRTRPRQIAAALLVAFAIGGSLHAQEGDRSRTVGTFLQQVGHRYTVADGLPANDVLAIAIARSGEVLAGTSRGLAVFLRTDTSDGERSWAAVPALAGRPIRDLAIAGNRLFVLSGDEVLVAQVGPAGWQAIEPDTLLEHREIADLDAVSCAGCAGGAAVWLASAEGLFGVRAEPAVTAAQPLLTAISLPRVRRLAVAASGLMAIATTEGVSLMATASSGDPQVQRLLPPPLRSPLAPRALASAATGELWLAGARELARWDPGTARWTVHGVLEGLPVGDFTSLAADDRGGVWAGTSRGLVHRTADGWEYRQGRRWLPDDRVRDVAVDAAGEVWTATAGGVGRIELRPLTLAAKADHFLDQIERYHRRTPYGFVDAVELGTPGDPSTTRQRDSDNDGLWTAMYGAAECYAFAVTGDIGARDRAAAAFRALRFLGEVTQGGTPPALPGFVARSILPADGPDPNRGLRERDLEHQTNRDRKWKLLEPRWPKSADGRWYWKADTSSDELDGHFFFYGLYYDLVADDAEKLRVRETVTAIVDHLIDHDFALVDHDGQPTRWAVFGPRAINHDPDWWEERGLNSLSILSYLRLAEHMSPDPRYGEIAQRLIDDHAYAANVRVPKIQDGPGTGNQSDDEMAFMGFYNLVRYEQDPQLRRLWAHSFWRYFQVVRPERNPLFHFLYAAVAQEERYRDAFEDLSLAPDRGWLDEAVDSLVRYPLDRVSWPLANSHRQDVVLLRSSDPERPRGHLRDGRVLPIDERFVNHWNHDPWQLDYRGDGRSLADGASFLLPYYLGRYSGFLLEETEASPADDGAR